MNGGAARAIRRCWVLAVATAGMMLGLGSCRTSGSEGRAAGTVEQQLTYSYWAAAGKNCPQRDLEPVLNDAAVVAQLVACSRDHTFKMRDSQPWVADAQVLVDCPNGKDNESSCHRHAFATATPFDSLAKVVDGDFTTGAVLVARITARKNYPNGTNWKIRGDRNEWENFIFLQNIGNRWKAFVLSVKKTGTDPRLQMITTGGQDPHHDESGAPVVPPAVARWVQVGPGADGQLQWLGDAEADSATATRSFDDGLWTRCGSGCCTMAFK